MIEEYDEYPGVSCYGAHLADYPDWHQFWHVRLYPPGDRYQYVCPLGDYPCEPDPDDPEKYYCTAPGGLVMIPTDTVDLSSDRRENADYITKSCRNEIVCIDEQCTRTEAKTICDFCLEDACWDNDYYDASSEFVEAMVYMQIAAEIGQDMKGLSVFNGFKETCVTSGGIIFTVDCCDELGSNADEVGTAIHSMKYAFGAYKYGRAIYVALTTPKYVITAAGTVAKLAELGDVAVEAVNALNAIQVSQLTGDYSLLFKEAGKAVFETAFGEGGILQSIFSTSMLIHVAIMVAVYFLIQWLTYTCESSDAPAAIKSRLGYCHYVGKYCEKKSIFGCMVKRKSYCCFQSKLARIINEQGREQIGKPWGSPKYPDCTGFTEQELAQLDFSQMDFSEIADEIIERFMQASSEDVEDLQNTTFDYIDYQGTFDSNLEVFVNSQILERGAGGLVLPGQQCVVGWGFVGWGVWFGGWGLVTRQTK
jgi:hypothetical protein